MEAKRDTWDPLHGFVVTHRLNLNAVAEDEALNVEYEAKASPSAFSFIQFRLTFSITTAASFTF
eukprot:811590-Pleurochrysis_carterae.AAC.1